MFSIESEPEPGVRGWLNAHPYVPIGAVVVIFALTLWATHRSAPTHQTWYTMDDGATYFAHDYEIPPFTHHGKEAVQAWVYSCDGGQTRFVGYLMKFTPEGQEAMTKLLAEREQHHSTGRFEYPKGVMVKKPGDANWVQRHAASGSEAAIERGRRIEAEIKSGVSPKKAMSDAGGDPYEQITNVTCPDGKRKPVLVDPS